MLTKYESSGRVGVATALAVIPITGALLVMGAVYQVLMHYVPLLILDGFIALCFAAAVAVVVAKVQKWCHCRHAGAGALVGLVSGAICVVATHYFSLAIHDKSLAPPSMLAEFLKVRAETGWNIGRFSSSGLPITGWAVWTVWGIEALLIVVAAVGGGVSSATEPYCEKCGVWADKVKAKVRVAEPAQAYVERVEKATEFKELGAKEKGGPLGSALEYMVKECPACAGVTTVSVSYEFEKADGKKTSKEMKQLQENVVLTAAEAEKLIGMNKVSGTGTGTGTGTRTGMGAGAKGARDADAIELV